MALPATAVVLLIALATDTTPDSAGLCCDVGDQNLYFTRCTTKGASCNEWPDGSFRSDLLLGTWRVPPQEFSDIQGFTRCKWGQQIALCRKGCVCTPCGGGSYVRNWDQWSVDGAPACTDPRKCNQVKRSCLLCTKKHAMSEGVCPGSWSIDAGISHLIDDSKCITSTATSTTVTDTSRTSTSSTTTSRTATSTTSTSTTSSSTLTTSTTVTTVTTSSITSTTTSETSTSSSTTTTIPVQNRIKTVKKGNSSSTTTTTPVQNRSKIIKKGNLTALAVVLVSAIILVGLVGLIFRLRDHDAKPCFSHRGSPAVNMLTNPVGEPSINPELAYPAMVGYPEMDGNHEMAGYPELLGHPDRLYSTIEPVAQRNTPLVHTMRPGDVSQSSQEQQIYGANPRLVLGQSSSDARYGPNSLLPQHRNNINNRGQSGPNGNDGNELLDTVGIGSIDESEQAPDGHEPLMHDSRSAAYAWSRFHVQAPQPDYATITEGDVPMSAVEPPVGSERADVDYGIMGRSPRLAVSPQMPSAIAVSTQDSTDSAQSLSPPLVVVRTRNPLYRPASIPLDLDTDHGMLKESTVDDAASLANLNRRTVANTRFGPEVPQPGTAGLPSTNALLASTNSFESYAIQRTVHQLLSPEARSRSSSIEGQHPGPRPKLDSEETKSLIGPVLIRRPERLSSNNSVASIQSSGSSKSAV